MPVAPPALPAAAASGRVPALRDRADLSAEDARFLDTLQHRTFRWFWETTNPANGLVPDRHPTPSFSSVAAVGFGLTAYPVAVERGWITREQALGRTLATLRFFWNAPQGPTRRGMTGHKGFFYHFLDMQTGARFGDVELSTIDTALLLYGALAAAAYFDRDVPEEAEVRRLADRLNRRVDWTWAQPFGPLVSMGWHPESGFIPHEYEGMNEAAFLYVLALGSPTHPLHASAWPAFTSTYRWASFYGHEHVNFAPLFGHQYTHVWLDLKGLQDPYMRAKGLDYFENSRRASLAQIAYAADNPNGWTGYSADLWGLTASDGPKDTTLFVNGRRRTFQSYTARGAAADEIHDDGTIAPTAAGGSLPFTPVESMRALRTMASRYGAHLYTRYGFLDSFNPSLTTPFRTQHGAVVPGVGWFNGDYLGIDQGSILLMAENHRSAFVWRLMRRSEPLVRGLRRAGFSGGWLNDAPAVPAVAEPARVGPLADPAYRVVVLGSSTAAGTGPRDVANAWANRLRAHAEAETPGAEVLNLAIGGYTTCHVVPEADACPAGQPAVDTRRNVTRALAMRPDALVVGLTSNDSDQRFPVAATLARFAAVERAARAAGVPVFFTTTAPRGFADPAQRALQAAVRDSLVARYGDARQGGHVVDFWAGVARPDGTIEPAYDSGDRVHFNDAAHRLFFERVVAAGVLAAAKAHAERVR